ncbi:MAG: tetratricopeptide repeat protein [Nitrospirae bacterium]|nr:tetratricopeptide repeat protein [Nitrospirota bacterium]MBF0617267.1 tetratricopeptide repeat protein [Nitrospirota bacterium]
MQYISFRKIIGKNANTATAIILFTVSVLTYLPVLHNDFVKYDDQHYITANLQIQRGLTFENVKWAVNGIVDGNWFPLTVISHMADISLYGLNPSGHHLTNVLIHALNSVILFIALTALGQTVWRGAFIALLFAIHPTRVESVAWVAERKDVLCALFCFLTIYLYAEYVRRPVVLRYLAVIFSFTLALMSKPMAVTLPFVLLLLDFWPLNRIKTQGSILRLLYEKIPLFLLVVISCFITFNVQKVSGAMTILPIDYRVENAVIGYAQYVYKLFIPVRLAVFYPLAQEISKPALLVSLIFVVTVSAVAISKIKINPYIFTGWFWFLGMLVPVIGLVQVGLQSMADRYTYMPYIGLFLIIANFSFDLYHKYERFKQLFYLVTVILAATMLSLTINQQHYWKDSITLFKHAVAVTKNNYVMYSNLGVALALNGDPQDGAEQLKKAIIANPNFSESYTNLGTVYLFQLKKPKEAVRCFEKSISINPNNADDYNGLGVVLALNGKEKDAIELFDKALTLDPTHSDAAKNKMIALKAIAKKGNAKL